MKTLFIILFLPFLLSAQTDIEKYPDNPVLDLGIEGSWDSHAVKTPNVLVDGTTYKMWYSGSDGVNTRIGYATSSDCINWIKYEGNPVLDLGAADSWDDETVSVPCVMFEGEIYKMWYHGSDGLTYCIGHATSSDGINWIKHDGNPVLERGIEGSWDGEYVLRPKVISNDNEYSMYYSGSNKVGQHSIGLAKSTDGINWTKDSLNPVMVASQSWEEPHISPGEILFRSGIYSMWYIGGESGFKKRSGYATSLDGKNWDKNTIYVLNYGAIGEWDYKFANIGSAYFDGSTYHFWYDSYDKNDITGAIGYATAPLDSITEVEREKVIPLKYHLHQNYPNPFNPITIIKYSILQKSNVTLKVFDVLGREISILVNKEQQQGDYEVEYDGNELTSGIYFYRLQAVDFVETKKMILLK